MERETKIENGGLDMGAMKNWLMEHDECIGDAIENGAINKEQVVAFCKTNMVMIDENYIKEQWDEFMAGPDRLTDEETLDLDNQYLNEQEISYR